MKRIYVLLLTLGVLLLVGCTKDYKAIAYTKFVKTFENDSNYILDNQSLKYENQYERFLDATGEKTKYYFYEFKTKEEARDYMISNYKDRDGFKFKDKNKYIEVIKNDEIYFQIIQVDNIIVSGTANSSKDKKEVLNIFKKLGY